MRFEESRGLIVVSVAPTDRLTVLYKVLHFAQDYALGCLRPLDEWELCYLIKSFSHYLKVHTLFSQVMS